MAFYAFGMLGLVDYILSTYLHLGARTMFFKNVIVAILTTFLSVFPQKKESRNIFRGEDTFSEGLRMSYPPPGPKAERRESLVAFSHLPLSGNFLIFSFPLSSSPRPFNKIQTGKRGCDPFWKGSRGLGSPFTLWDRLSFFR